MAGANVPIDKANKVAGANFPGRDFPGNEFSPLITPGANFPGANFRERIVCIPSTVVHRFSDFLLPKV